MSYKDHVSAIDILQMDGHTEIVGTPEVTVLQVDSDKNVLLAKGATVPTDADTGYATGCLFIDTTSGVGITLYINEGSATSADFNAIETPGAAITGVTAGTDMSGGGTSGTVTLNLSSTISQNLLFTGSRGIRFSAAVGTAVGSAAIFRFDSFSAAVGTATSTAFITGSTYNIAVQIPGIGTAYLKATMAE
jgi:hypothetical protein